MIFRILLCSTFFLFIGCTPLQKVVTEKLYPVVIEEQKDTLRADIITDTLIIASHNHLTDTVVVVKYFPLKRKFYYKIRADTVLIPITDTIFREVIKTEKENGLNYKHYLLFGMGLFLIAIFYNLWRKNR